MFGKSITAAPSYAASSQGVMVIQIANIISFSHRADFKNLMIKDCQSRLTVNSVTEIQLSWVICHQHPQRDQLSRASSYLQNSIQVLVFSIKRFLMQGGCQGGLLGANNLVSSSSSSSSSGSPSTQTTTSTTPTATTASTDLTSLINGLGSTGSSSSNVVSSSSGLPTQLTYVPQIVTTMQNAIADAEIFLWPTVSPCTPHEARYRPFPLHGFSQQKICSFISNCPPFPHPSILLSLSVCLAQEVKIL